MTTIEPWLREILRCPSCGGPLQDTIGPLSNPELRCTRCSLAYRVDDGIPVLLVDEARDAGSGSDAGDGPVSGDDRAASDEPGPGRE